MIKRYIKKYHLSSVRNLNKAKIKNQKCIVTLKLDLVGLDRNNKSQTRMTS